MATVLSSCGTTSVFDERACPREKRYSKAEQDQFLKDIPKTPRSVQGLVIDYGKMRDQARACRGEG